MRYAKICKKCAGKYCVGARGKQKWPPKPSSYNSVLKIWVKLYQRIKDQCRRFFTAPALRTLKDWDHNHEELRQQVKKYLHVVGGEDNRGSEKAAEQKRGEYAKAIAQWAWKLRYLKDEETIVAELMKAEVPIQPL